MYHHLDHNHSKLISSRTSFPLERNLFLQEGNGPGDAGLTLSTDAKPRLKWTPELHERFVESVNQLGGPEKATPKTVLRLMGIPELTLYHLKSHLQKYRLSKNLQAQTNGGTENYVEIPTSALDRTSSEGSGSFVHNINVGPHSKKTMQINEALQMQMEVQRRIDDQFEMQRHLQRQIEAQGRYLQSVLEKAQETLGKQNLGSAGLETAKIQPKILNECFTSAIPGLEETDGSHNLQGHVAQITYCSMESCLTSSEGSKKDQQMHNTNMVMGAYHGNLSLRAQEMQEGAWLAQIQSGWCADLTSHRLFSQSRANDSTHCTLPVSRSSSILSMSKTNKKDTTEGSNISEAHRRQRDEHNSYLEQAGYKANAIQQISMRNSTLFELPSATTQLDLNASNKYSASKNSNKFDLNDFG
ncbi:hypothetical protein M5K25_019745 [Dendrobium thyrsiflorum]|uniref:HTH myb-type domain-containing protein n=1 Tax=Dendrobium thyrsiflorum TaxID=117978 RepID=A0ABD0UML3_DENTH